jgi:hypothetical protein
MRHCRRSYSAIRVAFTASSSSCSSFNSNFGTRRAPPARLCCCHAGSRMVRLARWVR